LLLTGPQKLKATENPREENIFVVFFVAFVIFVIFIATEAGCR
jgi:hypothetical protein